MTMHQPAPIVPSNAPSHGESHARVPRVLQEHSGNRQPDCYGTLPQDQKYPLPYVTENLHPVHIQFHRPAYGDQLSPLQHNLLRHPQRFHTGYRDPQEVRKEARKLFHRFKSSDHYMKYRNRQHKDDSKTTEQKWPDQVEYAFFEALVNWPPMGRGKHLLKDKLRGRNELIADYIEEKTGEARTRKQVSSHIQVLKPFVENDPLIMRYLSKHDHNNQNHRYYTASSSSSAAGHYSTAGLRAAQHPAPHTLFTQMPLPPTSPCQPHIPHHLLLALKSSLATFQPRTFEIFAQRNFSDSTMEAEQLHVYTQSLPQPLKSVLVPTLASFAAEYPLLHAMQATRPIDCSVLVAECSMALPAPNKEWRDNSEGVELGILYQCTSQGLPVDMLRSVEYCNRFWHRGRECASAGAEVSYREGKEKMVMETILNFGSRFWARVLGNLAMSLTGVGEQGVGGAGGNQEDKRAEVCDELRNIAALQEMVVKVGNGVKERVLVVYWQFRLSRKEVGSTCWRPLKIPVQEGASSYDEAVCSGETTKNERLDSQSDNCLPQQPYDTTYSTIQSPFSCHSTSTNLNHAPWPSSALDDEASHAASSALSLYPSVTSETFDFSTSSLNLHPYDSVSALNFSTFDASTFDFGNPHSEEAGLDFVTDPTLDSHGPVEAVAVPATDLSFAQEDLFQSQGWYDEAFFCHAHPPVQTAAEHPTVSGEAPLCASPLGREANAQAEGEAEELDNEGMIAAQHSHSYDFGLANPITAIAATPSAAVAVHSKFSPAATSLYNPFPTHTHQPHPYDTMRPHPHPLLTLSPQSHERLASEGTTAAGTAPQHQDPKHGDSFGVGEVRSEVEEALVGYLAAGGYAGGGAEGLDGGEGDYE